MKKVALVLLALTACGGDDPASPTEIPLTGSGR